MSSVRTDGRDAAAVVAAIEARLPGFVPDWSIGDRGPAAALVQAHARYVAAMAERLGRAPAKHQMAFLDLLGVSLLPAQAARAPITFTLAPGAGDTRILAGSQVAASLPGRSTPLVFETEADCGLTAAHLVDVISVAPGADGWADHSDAARARTSFTLFDGLAPIAHELYLGHGQLLALDGASVVEVQLELAQVAAVATPTIWEYWDGAAWRAFRPFQPGGEGGTSIDGTKGLTRSGTLRLVTECSSAQPRVVSDQTSCWIRGRLAGPIQPVADGSRAAIDRVRLRSIIAPSMGTLTLYGPDGGEADEIEVQCGDVSRMGIDLAAARATLRDVADDAKEFPVLDLASGVARWTSLAAATYEVSITVDGYTPTRREVTPADHGSTLYLGPDFVGRLLDRALVDGLPVDLSNTFFPFGQQPQPGTTFAFALDAALAKPGALLTLKSEIAGTGRSSDDPDTDPVSPTLVAEYYDGSGWRPLPVDSAALLEVFTDGSYLTIEVPDVAPVELAGSTARWLRIRIVSDTFAVVRTTTWTDGAGDSHTFRTTEITPPALSMLRAGYVYRSPQAAPEACLTRNDFAFVDHVDDARDRGGSFEPFAAVADRTPTVYLGFDRPLPADLLNVYVGVTEVVGVVQGAALVWEGWDGSGWSPLGVQDETRDLALPGMVGVSWPGTPPPPNATVVRAGGAEVQVLDEVQAALFRAGDLVVVSQGETTETATVVGVRGDRIALRATLATEYHRGAVTLAGLPRFGTPRGAWIRARLRVDGDPTATRVEAIDVNAVWAAQVQTIVGEVLGGSTGEPRQVLRCRSAPVLPGQVIEVRELDGPRAEVEQALLRDELAAAGLADDVLRVVADPRTGRAAEAWVRWEERPHLFFSAPTDRHYVVERSTGRISFGDNRHGRIPPAGADNLRAASYRSGGGTAGNVPAGAITQVLAGVLATGARNVRPAEGGADGEPAIDVLRRGPKVLRHRRQALSLQDYESLAAEASPAVAVARAQPTTDPGGREVPGWVRVAIVPHSADPRPLPSFGLRREVEGFLRARVPASMAGQVTVALPTYHPVGVAADVVADEPANAGAVIEAVVAAAQTFLHPLRGGPSGEGWPFGRDVFASDLASVLESVPGVDHLSALELLVDGVPRGGSVEVPADRIVVAGTLRIRSAGTED